MVLIVGGIIATQDAVRHTVADALGVGLKNDIISVYSLATAPPTDTDNLAPIRYDNVAPYAVNVFLDQEVQTSSVRRTLAMVKAAGFHYIKQELLWSDIERPEKGEYQDKTVPGKSSWAKYDRIVDLAQQEGIGIIFRIDTTPAWARPPGAAKLTSPEKVPPLNYQDYGDFVAAVVQRYKGRVHYYQIWNEPNLASEWGGQRPDPAAYTRLLRIAYTRAKEVDSSVVILSAALAPTIQNDQTAMPDTTFLRDMYADGARPYFDIMSANAYGLRDGPDDYRLAQADDVNFSRPVLLREIMVQNGDADKPIWASEMGWDSLPENWSTTHPGQEPIWGSVSRALQAAYTVRAFERAQQQWPWMGLMAVWHFRMVYPQNAESQQYYFDMVSVNWQIEPIYYALQKLMTAPPVLYRGFHQEHDWVLNWSHGWEEVSDPRASLGQLKVTNTPGAEFSFDVEGSWLDLVTPTGPDWGKVAVTIDGLPFAANQLPIENGQAVLDLHGATERWQVWQPIAEGLSPGVHHVTIRALSGKVGIDGVIVDAPSPQIQLYETLFFGVLGIALLVLGRVRPAWLAGAGGKCR